MVLEEAYKISGKRTSRSVQGTKLSDLSWGPLHEKAFEDLHDQLRNAVKLSHRDHAKSTCVYTDASDEQWPAVVTQCDPSQLGRPLEEQMHQPLAFLGGEFNNTKKRWRTFEKEAFAIYQSFKKMNYFFLCESSIHLYTDHRNLLFVFNPTALQPTLGRHIVNKVQRWALFLSRFMYSIEHIDGERNIATDMLTRWYAGYRGKRSMARKLSSLLLTRDIVPSPFDDDFIWPSLDDIRESQAKGSCLPERLEADEDSLLRLDGKLWIPDDDFDLQLKLLVVSHFGHAGHRGVDSTLSSLREEFGWKGTADGVASFINSCIHCIIAKGGERVPRPISLTLHGTKPNEVVHFDFLCMGVGAHGLKYVLVIKDDLSSYIWLCPFAAADSEVAAREIARWIRIFTTMDFWVSDQCSHFKNELMKAIANAHKINHTFTVSYSPWVNGTVENTMRHIRAACTALISEFKLAPQDWTSVIHLVMIALNEAPLKRLGKRKDGTFRTPLEVMTGIKPNRINFPVKSQITESDRQHIAQVRLHQLIQINALQKTIDEMHKDVSASVSKNGQSQIRSQNQKTNLIETNFSVGDYVLVRKGQEKGHKMSFRWSGLRRITRILGDTVYEETGIIDPCIETVHASRLRLYRADLDGKELSDELNRQAEHIESKFEMVDKLLDIGEAEDGILIRVQWLGQPD